MIALWTYLGINAWHTHSWFFLVLSAYFIGTDWKRLWRTYDENRKDN